MIRMSSSQIFNNNIQRLNELNTQQSRTQEQISTGKRVLNPSDDPVGATRILQLNQDLARSEQFGKNLDLSQNRLERQDSTLSSISDSINRARELTVNAGNGSLNMDDRKSIAGELSQLREQMASLANTRGPDGEYLYGGFKGQQQPFQKDASGSYRYMGDEGQRSVEIDNGVTLQVTNNGKETFVDVPSDRPTFDTKASSRNQAEPPATITTGMVTDREAFEEFHPDDIDIRINDDGTYTARSRETGRELATDNFISGEPLNVNGVEFTISGDPEPGDSFSVETSEKQGLLTTMEKLIYSLENQPDTPEGRDALRDSLDGTLDNLDNARDQALTVQTDVGNRLNTISSTREFLEDSDMLSKKVLSDLEDLDYAEAISRLTQESFVLQAAQQSFAQIARLSLFDSL